MEQFQNSIAKQEEIIKNLRRIASIQLLGKIVGWISILVILTLGNPDLLDAIIHRVGGWQ